MIFLTDDADHMVEVVNGLKANGGYCPCKIEKTPENKCQCKEFRDAIEKEIEGPCHCGLWFFQKD